MTIIFYILLKVGDDYEGGARTMSSKLPCVFITEGWLVGGVYNRLSGTFGADGLKIKLEKCPAPIILEVTVFIIPKLPTSRRTSPTSVR